MKGATLTSTRSPSWMFMFFSSQVIATRIPGLRVDVTHGE
jgi:hypothetical protein